jgi:hypothetical protein
MKDNFIDLLMITPRLGNVHLTVAAPVHGPTFGAVTGCVHPDPPLSVENAMWTGSQQEPADESSRCKANSGAGSRSLEPLPFQRKRLVVLKERAP